MACEDDEFMDFVEDELLTHDGGGSRNNHGGCYIATAVYGSYNCPQVWTLRRYRDSYLAGNWWGRAFIRVYYAFSPVVVKLFGKRKWFIKLFRPWLDRKVEQLKVNGYKDTPYRDRNWMR